MADPASVPFHVSMTYFKIVFPLALIMFLVGADEYVLSSILSPMGESFHVEPARVALLVTAYALPCAVLGPLFGALSDRWGRRRVVLPSLAIFTIATYAVAAAPTFPVALLARFICGSAAAALGPNAFALVGDLIPPERRPAAMGHTMMGLTIGFIASPALGGWITEQFGWRWAFVVLGTCGIGAWVSAALAIPHRSTPEGEGAGTEVESVAAGVVRAFALRGVPAGIASQGLWIGATIGVMAISGEIFRTRYALSVSETGMWLASFGVLTIAGNLLVAPTVSWTGSTKRAVLLGIVGTWFGIGGLTLVPSFPFVATLVSFWLWAVFAGFGGPALQALLADLAGERRATVLSISASAMQLGVVATTFFTAWTFPQFGSVGVGVVACCSFVLSFILQARSSGSTA
ncbi:MFS transporter [Pendulispora rubella]|uniref:MFS transporter n=1 Tax=Pendulispora rubella TaxID=2741070 RepID=A0ABZ2KUA2_9BACT